MSSNLDITHVYKCLHEIFIVTGLQKFSFERNNVPKPLSCMAKIYPVIFWVCVVYFYYESIKINYKSINESLTGSTHAMIVLGGIILASSIFSSVFKNPLKYFKLVQNVIYFDEILRIPASWYKNTRFRVSVIFVVYVIYFVFVSACDFTLWYNQINLYMILVLTFTGDLIAFQYLFDVWIIANRLKTLTKQLIRLGKPALCLKVDYNYQTDWLIEKDQKNIYRSVKEDVQENFEFSIVRLMSVYDKLADNVDIINTTYGVQVRQPIVIFQSTEKIY